MQVTLAAWELLKWPMVASDLRDQNTCETKYVSQPSLPTENKAGIVIDTLEGRRWKMVYHQSGC